MAFFLFAFLYKSTFVSYEQGMDDTKNNFFPPGVKCCYLIKTVPDEEK